MAESKYGRLFTEADVRGLIALALTDPLLPNHSVDPYEVADRILYNPQPPTVTTFPADEPLFLLRGQDRALVATLAAYYAMVCSLVGRTGTEEQKAHASAVIGRLIEIAEWQREHPDRVKVPD